MKTTQPWYQILAAKDGDPVEVLIYGEIGESWFGGIGAEQFVKDLQALKGRPLNVRINSVGGQVFEGLAIFNALQRHDARVVTHVDGLAASIASVIALAGAEVRMAENAFLMIHNAHAIAFGNAGDMRQMADTLEKVTGSLVAIYAARTGKKPEEIQDLLDAETWFTAAEAKEAGFVDAISEPKNVKASGDLSRFRNAPRALAAEPVPAAPPAPPAPAPVIEAAPAVGPSPELVALAAASFRTLSESRL